MIKLNSLVAISILLTFFLSGCSNDEPVVEVDSFVHGDEEVIAGNQFRITPLKDEMINLRGEGFSMNNFDFHCILLSKEKETDSLFKGVIAIDLSSKNITKTLKHSAQEFEKWPSSATKKEITIDFPILPGEVYSGKGFFYFYLVNKKDQCISNIVRWKVKFE
jgi:hypothetical protein